MPVLPPAGTRLVLMSEDIAGLMGTRTEDGDRLLFEFGQPDQNGWSELIVTRETPEPFSEFDDEVLFLTSNQRIYEAYRAWFEHYSPGSAENKDDSIARTRELLKYLKIPTSREILNYRAEELP